VRAVCNRLRAYAKIIRMADFGEVTYINAAVQVIPVLAVVVVADSFIRRDAADPVERIYASNAVAVGLIFGIAGEVFGLQALLTGPTRQTIPTVSAGLMALAATALGPRLAELHVPWYPDVARRIAHRLLPRIIGTVGLVFGMWRAPLGFRLFVYVLLALGWFLAIPDVIRLTRRSRRVRAHSTATQQEGPPLRPADTPPSAPGRSACWWLVACITGIAVGIGIGRRKATRYGRPR
jgi:hypothetical protein